MNRVGLLKRKMWHTWNLFDDTNADVKLFVVDVVVRRHDAAAVDVTKRFFFVTNDGQNKFVDGKFFIIV
jgi:hypothetical protein